MKINYKNYILTRVYRDGHDRAFKIADNDGRDYRTLFRPISNLEQAKQYVDELVVEIK
jgi:hypothetical protein|tara:strand:- start:615 stop:788 length:174 start_codon:yes stop_codon:yes gene_type:complete